MDTVKLERVRLLHQLSPPTYTLSYAIAVIYVVAYWAVSDQNFLISWLVLFTVITLARGVLGYIYLSSVKHQQNPDLWARIYCVGIFSAACSWALFALQLDIEWPAVHQIMLFTALTALIAGAVGSHSCYYPALMSFYVPIMLVLAWISTRLEENAFLWLIPLIAVFWVIIHISGMRFSGMLKANIRIQQSLAEANEKLELIATLDSLTQLSNRGALEKYLHDTWPRCFAHKRPVSIAMIDVDLFKAYNDCYGHIEGDKCLMVVANVLGAAVPAELGFVGRYGGEEFIVVLPGVEMDEAIEILGQAKAELAEKEIEHLRSTVDRYVTFSLGIASAVPVAEDDWAELIDRADAKLYIAKQRGRNQIVI